MSENFLLTRFRKLYLGTGTCDDLSNCTEGYLDHQRPIWRSIKPSGRICRFLLFPFEYSGYPTKWDDGEYNSVLVCITWCIARWNLLFCSYEGKRELSPPHDFTRDYYEDLVARGMFFILFLITAFISTSIISRIDDTPGETRQIVKREKYLRMHRDPNDPGKSDPTTPQENYKSLSAFILQFLPRG